jgi:hypothetical protein
VPDTPAAEVSTIGKLNVSSVTGNVTLDLVLVDTLDNRTVLGSLVLAGLTVHGLELQLSRAFFLALTKISLPIKGYIRASDRRTECVLHSRSVVTGPCFKVAPFTLDVADFNPFCPDDIYRFALEDQISITWTEPRLVSVSGATVALVRSHAPGSDFREGTTTVSYAPQSNQDPSQPTVKGLTCVFKVCFPTAAGFWLRD